VKAKEKKSYNTVQGNDKKQAFRYQLNVI